jgi:hypothetical protein
MDNKDYGVFEMVNKTIADLHRSKDANELLIVRDQVPYWEDIDKACAIAQ